jgi:hypothetical protein
MTAHINRPHTGNCPSIRILAPVCRLFQPTERGNEDNEIAEQNNSPDKSPGITRSVHQAARWRALSPEMTIRALFIRASSASDLNLFVFLIRNILIFILGKMARLVLPRCISMQKNICQNRDQFFIPTWAVLVTASLPKILP